jgi:elongation factor 1-gamma
MLKISPDSFSQTAAKGADHSACNKAATTVPSGKGAAAAAAAGAGAAAGGKKAKKEKKAKKAAAAAPVEATPAEAPKPPKPFEGLDKGTMDMESFKRHYSNAPPDAQGDRDYYATMPPFFSGEGPISAKAKFDPAAYSIWFCDYKFNEENTMDFTTANLVGGFIQRSDAIRRGAFGTMLILGDTTPYEITGCWMFQGDSVKEILENNPDAEYYTWTKADTSDAAAQKRIADYWCTVDKLEGKTVYDSKLFK